MIRYQRQSESSQTSDSVIAINLPSKYDSSYVTIMSNIINTSNYFGGNDVNNMPVMALCNRSYTTGDYFYLNNNNFQFVADRDFTLSDFDVRICRPDGSLANVDSDCSVIFKITSTKMIMGDNEK